MRVRENMTRNIIVLFSDSTLDEAYEIMQEENIRHLPVVDERSVLIGLISERDILVHSALEDGELNVPESPIYEIMTTNLATCSLSSSIAEVAQTFIEKKINCLPVVAGNKELLGLVTTDDLLVLLLNHKDVFSENVLPFEFKVSRSIDRESKPRPWI